MEYTLALIKPDGVRRGLTGECIGRILQEGLTLAETKTFTMSRAFAETFRKELKEKYPALWDSLIDYMTEGPSIAFLVQGEEAIMRVRKLCGVTNPRDALKGTIRGDFREGDMQELSKQGKVVKNILHASGNAEEAAQEIRLIFEHDAMKQPSKRDTKGGRKE